MTEDSSPFKSWIVDGDILAILLNGSLDTGSTPEFDAEVRRHLDQGHKKFIIDCRNLGYVSSVGIGALVAMQTRLRRQGGAVKLAAVQGPVMQLIRTVRLDRLLDIYGDLEFARQSFYETNLAPTADA